MKTFQFLLAGVLVGFLSFGSNAGEKRDNAKLLLGSWEVVKTDGLPVGSVLDFGKELWAVETKLRSEPGPGDFSKLNKTADLIKADKRILVSQTRECVADERHFSCNLPWLAKHIGDL